jgi:hypothetical protein
MIERLAPILDEAENRDERISAPTNPNAGGC